MGAYLIANEKRLFKLTALQQSTKQIHLLTNLIFHLEI